MRPMRRITMCDLYDLVQVLTQKFQRKNKDLDYENMVAGLQECLGEEGLLEFPAWHRDLSHGEIMYCTFTKKILPLPEKIISGHGKEELLDKNHFMIQIFRIPYTEQPNLFNLLRVAVYTGLLMLTLRSNDFPDGIVKAYKDLKMHNLINFVSRDDYTALMEQMPDDMVRRVTDGLVACIA
jgi:hypothetical protein